MPTGLGYQTISGVGIESVVGTGVAATQRVRNLAFSPDEVYAFLLDNTLSGTVGQVTPELGMRDIRGSFQAYLTYTTSHVLLTHFFGSFASSAYTFLDSLLGKGLTWAIDKQVSIWELLGVKINQLVLEFGPEGAMLTGTFIAQDIKYASTVNTTATLAALIPNIDPRCKLAPDLDVRLGVASATLGVGQSIKCVSGKVTLTRLMAETHTSGTRNIIEPAPDNFLQGDIELVLARYDTNQYMTWRTTNTRLACQLIFTEEAALGTHTQTWTIPNLTLSETPTPVSGPGFIPLSLKGPISIGQDSLTATTISVVSADNSFNDSGNAMPFVYPGATLISSGFTAGADNATSTVVSRTAGRIIVTGPMLVNEAAGGTRTLITRNPFVRVTET